MSSAAVNEIPESAPVIVFKVKTRPIITAAILTFIRLVVVTAIRVIDSVKVIR